MSRKLLFLATAPLLYAAAAFAQSADQPPAGTDTPVPPPAATAPAPDASDPSAASTESAEMGAEDATGAETDAAPSTTAAAGGSEILTEESDDQVRADNLLGMKVVDMAGDEIGEVEDILLDKNGQVAGLVLGTGKVLGMGGKSVAVSWQDLAAADEAEAITLNLTEEQVAAAPEFRTKEDIEREEMENAEPAAGGGTLTAPAPADQQ